MMQNIPDGDGYTARGIDLAVNPDDAVHVVRAKVLRTLLCLQQPHPNPAMTEVTAGICVQPIVAHRPFDGGELRDDVRVGDREDQRASLGDADHLVAMIGHKTALLTASPVDRDIDVW